MRGDLLHTESTDEASTAPMPINALDAPAVAASAAAPPAIASLYWTMPTPTVSSRSASHCGERRCEKV